MNVEASQDLTTSPDTATDEVVNYRGWISDISRNLDVSRQAVASVIKGRKTSARIARAIVEHVGKTHAELWPGKYPEAEVLEAMAAQQKGGTA